MVKWCPGAESNHRHCDFQSHALPTELPGRRAVRDRLRAACIEGTAGPVHRRAPATCSLWIFRRTSAPKPQQSQHIRPQFSRKCRPATRVKPSAEACDFSQRRWALRRQSRAPCPSRMAVPPALSGDPPAAQCRHEALGQSAVILPRRRRRPVVPLTPTALPSATAPKRAPETRCRRHFSGRVHMDNTGKSCFRAAFPKNSDNSDRQRPLDATHRHGRGS